MRDSGNARTLRKHARTHLKASSHLLTTAVLSTKSEKGSSLDDNDN